MMSALDAYKIRQDFAILDQVVNDEPLVYLDNAATTQKPQVVLDALMAYYHEDNANVVTSAIRINFILLIFYFLQFH